MGTLEADLLVHGLSAARAGQTREAVYYLATAVPVCIQI